MDTPRLVVSEDQLNFLVRHFAPRISLRVSQEAVIATTSTGEFRVPATISVRSDKGVVLGIGDDPVDSVNASTVSLFSPGGIAREDYDNLLDKFFRVLLQRAGGGSLMRRPVVIAEGLNSLPPDLSERVREGLIRALPRAGAAAIVLDTKP